ncbi:MAG TPA: pantoate--beta-alanine ligase, partial [Propionibacteriaceae bacterium]|nr:pantoate--beta-alanine ligase [Propionibacteriaceae bacterium]
MKITHSITEYAALRSALEGHASPRVAYVPTMGALHEGHRSLIKLAKSRGDVVVVSIFVNPLQFGPGEDYARYPRPLEDDLQVCQADGVDIVFVPSVPDLYPAGRQVTVDAGILGSLLEGQSRPGHFNGVLTVVLKLFNIIRPHVAVFGEKDAQQLACIQRMVADLNLSVELVGAPIVREPDGLALSSRNIFLTPSERAIARSLSAALEKAATQSSVPSA